MEVLSEADVVLVLGSALLLHNTRPQMGMDYWPREAKIIQV